MVHIKIGVRICGSLDSLDRRHTAAGLVGRDVYVRDRRSGNPRAK